MHPSGGHAYVLCKWMALQGNCGLCISVAVVVQFLLELMKMGGRIKISARACPSSAAHICSSPVRPADPGTTCCVWCNRHGNY